MNISSNVILSAAIVLALAAPIGMASASSRPVPGQSQDLQFLHQPANGLVQAVRQATARFQDVNQAIQAGYTQLYGCVSSPDQGAMGVHYFKFSIMFDGAIDAAQPEVLVYEPTRFGRLHLVAVEYLVNAALWDGNEAHTVSGIPMPPSVMGQSFDYTGEPNRFRAMPYYGLHVWAWKYNPKGVFSMWNPRVSCADYTE